MVLLPQPLRSRRGQEQLGWALANARVWGATYVARDVRFDRDPGLAAVIRAEHARRGDPDVHALAVAGIELDRMAGHPSSAREPTLTCGVLEDAAIHLPCLATVIRAEQHPGVAPQVQPFGLLRPPRLEVPYRVQRQPRLLRQSDLLRPCPRLSPVRRALDGRPVD